MSEPAPSSTLEHPLVASDGLRVARASIVAFFAGGTQSFELSPGQAVVVGRGFPAELVIDDASLSRQHARFVWHDDGNLEVEDLGSRNGTLVASERVQRKLLQPGERVQLGAVTCAIYRMDPRERSVNDLGSYDELMLALRAELTRAREFGRSAGLLAMRAHGGNEESRRVAAWAPQLAASLRAVDRVAVYDAHSVLVLLPELGLEAAAELARSLHARLASQLELRIGVAAYPVSAGTHEKLVSVAHEALRLSTAQAPVHVLSAASAPLRDAVQGVVVRSRSMVELYELVRRVAERSVAVLVLGETGTGKEVIASAIHAGGARAKGPLRAVNCAAIPATLAESMLFGHERGAFTGAHQNAKGVFEEADGGTLFLDEIGDLSLAAQAALLRVLETRRITRVGSHRELEVDVRVVAATHRDLDAMVERGEFRADLLYRLNAITLHVPPLRERPEEIEPLAQHFVQAIARAWKSPVATFAPDALECLQSYSWPGNVRELRNVMERALVVCSGDIIRARDLTERVREAAGFASSATLAPPALAEPAADGAEAALSALAALDVQTASSVSQSLGTAPGQAPLRERLKSYEVQLILDALRASGGSQVRAAALLDLPVRTLVHKIKTLGIRHAYARE